MTHYQNITFCLLLAICAVGCSNKIKVHGTVVFEDDQSPLTVGTVLLQHDTYSAKGQIQADGSFQISSIKNNDGVPPGVYRVAITGAMKWPEAAVDMNDIPVEERVQTGRNVSMDPTPLIHPKYMSAQTSGITYDTSKDKVLNINVERPGK